MSVSILQEPTQLNTVYTKLLYSITTEDFSLPQYKFVCDILDYNGDLIQRVKQPANSAGHAIFNVAVPIRPQLQVDDTLYIQEPTASIGYGDNPINSYKQFKVKFGEEYGTSPSSSVIIYDGDGGTGNPAVSGSDLVLGRMTWEPWNEGFALSSSASPAYTPSGTGSFNFYVYEAAAPNYVDVNLRVNGSVPAGGFGGSGSFSYSASLPSQITTGNGMYDLEVYSSVGVPSANARASLVVYDMSNQQTVLSITDVSGSGGPNETLITASFTGSTGVVYGCRVNGIPTSSFNPPAFQFAYNSKIGSTAPVQVGSGAYPVFPGQFHNTSNYATDVAFDVVSNTAFTTQVGQVLEVYPTEQDFNIGEVPFITPPDTGSYASFNFNAQDVRINFTSSNPSYTGNNNFKAILTNWPQYQREQLTNDRIFDNLAVNGGNRFRTVSENDLGIVSWFNISGSISPTDTTDRAYAVHLYYFSPESGSQETGEIQSSVKFTGPALTTLSPYLTQQGNGADIPFCSGPVFPGNLPGIDGDDPQWNFLQLQLNQGSINWWKRDEPCDWETRSNFAFINKWGVWDFIGLNTTTNKNAVINERNEFQKVNSDYNSATSLYSPYNRGFEQYYLKQNYKYKISTDYIAGVHSSFYGDFAIENFYQELFISPNVMLQVEDTFVPINITNSAFRYKTNKKGQKKYQVEIEYEFSNKPRSRT